MSILFVVIFISSLRISSLVFSLYILFPDPFPLLFLTQICTLYFFPARTLCTINVLFNVWLFLIKISTDFIHDVVVWITVVSIGSYILFDYLDLREWMVLLDRDQKAWSYGSRSDFVRGSMSLQVGFRVSKA